MYSSPKRKKSLKLGKVEKVLLCVQTILLMGNPQEQIQSLPFFLPHLSIPLQNHPENDESSIFFGESSTISTSSNSPGQDNDVNDNALTKL